MGCQNISDEVEWLKIIYKEIIDGFVFYNNCYIKHLNELEQAEIVREKILIFNKYKAEGLLSEEEKLKQILESEIWSKEKEDQILEYKVFINDNEKNLKKVIPQQHGPILKIIQEIKEKLGALILERSSHIGLTANDCAERESINYLIFLSFYKDRDLKEKLFQKGLDSLEHKEIEAYIRDFSTVSANYSENNIRKIAVLPFFLNSFSYCKDSVYNFLGKPIIQLTSYQLSLFSLGNRNLTILNQAKGEPKELGEDVNIQEIVDWYDLEFSVLLGKRNTTK